MAGCIFLPAGGKSLFRLRASCSKCLYGLQQRSRTAVKLVNYYDVLEVSPKASQAQIKAAYYRLSKRYHPDVAAPNVREAKEKFATLSAAYEVLGNPRSRISYDHDVLGQSRSRYASDVSDVDVEYREFVRRRGAFKNRPGAAATGGRSPIFNFDEFYRQHYGESIRQAQVDKKAQEELNRKQEQENIENESKLIAVYFTFVVITFYALMKLLR